MKFKKKYFKANIVRFFGKNPNEMEYYFKISILKSLMAR